MPEWVLLPAGALAVGVALVDVFHTVLRPGGRGTLSRIIAPAVWRVARRLPLGSGRTAVGPLAMLAVVATWAVLVAAGWAMVYLAGMPGGFSYSGIGPAGRGGPVDAVYLSLVTLGTLGYGDVVPTSTAMRLAAPVQALVGFGLLTAAVSWVIEVYPALARRRTLALRIALADRADLLDARARAREELMRRFADDLAAVRVDFTQYAVTYYFADSDPLTSLPHVLPQVLTLAAAGRRAEDPSVRRAAALLDATLDDLARVLDREFLGCGGGTADVLAAYAADHRQRAPV